MQKYEYISHVCHDEIIKDSVLAKKGQEGWKLAAASQRKGSEYITYHFYRPLPGFFKRLLGF